MPVPSLLSGAYDRERFSRRQRMSQEVQGTPAENDQAGHNNNRWQSNKEGLRGADGPEEPGHVQPNHSHGHVSAETPERFTGLRLYEPHTKAAGLPAVLRATQYVWEH